MNFILTFVKYLEMYFHKNSGKLIYIFLNLLKTNKRFIIYLVLTPFLRKIKKNEMSRTSFISLDQFLTKVRGKCESTNL